MFRQVVFELFFNRIYRDDELHGAPLKRFQLMLTKRCILRKKICSTKKSLNLSYEIKSKNLTETSNASRSGN